MLLWNKAWLISQVMLLSHLIVTFINLLHILLNILICFPLSFSFSLLKQSNYFVNFVVVTYHSNSSGCCFGMMNSGLRIKFNCSIDSRTVYIIAHIVIKRFSATYEFYMMLFLCLCVKVVLLRLASSQFLFTEKFWPLEFDNIFWQCSWFC